jgi:hypothetical protein
MFERLLSRLRGRRRSAAPRRGRAAAPPAQTDVWSEAGGRHRRAVPATPPPPGVPAEATPGAPPGTVPAARVADGPSHIPPPARHDETAWAPAPASRSGTARGGAARGGAARGGAGRARVRTTPRAKPVRQAPVQRTPKPSGAPGPPGRAGGGQGRAEAARPWYEMAGGWQRTDGSKHCGSLEPLVRRQWDAAQPAPAEVLSAVNRLAELPQKIKDLLVTAVDAIYVGPGGVPELDDMGRLKGVALPSGRATGDACAGAYGDRKIVVGTRPSPSPDVMCHEVGHAIDDADAPPGRWQSDSAEFRMLYDQCLPLLVSDFHRQQGALGRREFFADAFAAIASRQRPALVDMLGGSTRVALNVMLFYNRRYGI